jgi:hypothetical protein
MGKERKTGKETDKAQRIIMKKAEAILLFAIVCMALISIPCMAQETGEVRASWERDLCAERMVENAAEAMTYKDESVVLDVRAYEVLAKRIARAEEESLSEGSIFGSTEIVRYKRMMGLISYEQLCAVREAAASGHMEKITRSISRMVAQGGKSDDPERTAQLGAGFGICPFQRKEIDSSPRHLTREGYIIEKDRDMDTSRRRTEDRLPSNFDRFCYLWEAVPDKDYSIKTPAPAGYDRFRRAPRLVDFQNRFISSHTKKEENKNLDKHRGHSYIHTKSMQAGECV